MKSLKYSLPISMLIWFIPIVSGVIAGSIIGFVERKIMRSIISSIILSIIASAFYIILSIYFLKIAILGNLISLSISAISLINSFACIITSYFISSRAVFSSVNHGVLESEFHVKSEEELKRRLNNYTFNCRDPVYKFHEDKKVEANLDCNEYYIYYEVVNEGRGYRVKLKVKPKAIDK
jgi:Zn-dependent protease with chaperone function